MGTYILQVSSLRLNFGLESLVNGRTYISTDVVKRLHYLNNLSNYYLMLRNFQDVCMLISY